jgi:hypothetical protein
MGQTKLLCLLVLDHRRVSAQGRNLWLLFSIDNPDQFAFMATIDLLQNIGFPFLFEKI